MSAEITTGEVNEYEMSNRGAELVLWARNLKITNSAECRAAGERVKLIALLRKDIKETFDPICASANEAHKTATKKRAEHLAQPDEADVMARQKITRFLADEERREREIAAAEQCRLQKEADDAALAEAAQLEAAGLPELAEEVIASPPVVAPVPVQRTQMAGISQVATWSYSLLPEVVTPRTDEEEADLMDAAANFILACNHPHMDVMLPRQLKTRAAIIRKRLKRYYMVADTAKIENAKKAMKKDAEREVGGILVVQNTGIRPSGR